MKRCPDCDATKPIEQFARDKNRGDGRVGYCKACVAIRSRVWFEKNKEKAYATDKAWREANPERTAAICKKSKQLARAKNPDLWKRKRRNESLRWKYGITIEEYESMVQSQNNVCEICQGTDDHRKNGHLSVDHNHETGDVRGLLCGHCNSLIGYAAENSDVLSSAMLYLEKYNAG